MLVSDQHQAILFCNENTGSRATFDFLAANYNFIERNHKHNNSAFDLQLNFGQNYLANIRANYKKIVTVRDPFRRVIGIYQRLLNEQRAAYGYGIWNTFPEFVQFLIDMQHAPQQSPEFPNWQSAPGARWSSALQDYFFLPTRQADIVNIVKHDFGPIDYYIRYETLTESIEALPFVNPPVVLQTIGQLDYNWEDYDTPENRALVQAWCPEDFNL